MAGISFEDGRLDRLRALACFMVVLLHASVYPFNLGGADSGWFAAAFFSSVTRPCVPLFLMISGYLLLDRAETPRSFYFKRAGRILRPFIFYSVGYYLAGYLFGRYDSLLGFFPTFLQGPRLFGHLGFMYLICGVYALMPFLRKIFQHSSKSEMKYLIAAWSLLAVTSGTLQPFGGFTWNFNGIADLSYFASMLVYVFIGGYAKRFSQAAGTSVMKPALMAGLAALLLFGSTAAVSLSRQAPDEAFLHYTSIFVFVYSVLLFRVLLGGGRRISSFMAEIARCSYGIYLIHIFFLTTFIEIGFHGALVHPLFGVPLFAGVVFLISFLSIFMAGRIPYFRRLTG